MHRKHVPPVPVAREWIARRRRPLRGDRDRLRNRRIVERLPFQRLLHCCRADRGWRHRAIGDARSLRATSANGSTAAMDKTEAPCGCRRITLAKRNAFTGGSANAIFVTIAAARFARSPEIFQAPASRCRSCPRPSPRHQAPAARPKGRHMATARKDCRRRSPSRALPARRSHSRQAQEGERRMRRELRHCDRGADVCAPAVDADPVEAKPVGEHEAADRHVAGRVVANDECSAAEEAGAWIGSSVPRRFPEESAPHDLQRHRPPQRCLVG